MHVWVCPKLNETRQNLNVIRKCFALGITPKSCTIMVKLIFIIKRRNDT